MNKKTIYVMNRKTGCTEYEHFFTLEVGQPGIEPEEEVTVKLENQEFGTFDFDYFIDEIGNEIADIEGPIYIVDPYGERIEYFDYDITEYYNADSEEEAEYMLECDNRDW